MQIRTGGLMRCCLETLRATHPQGEEGDIRHCSHCSFTVIYRDGAWEWNYPKKEGN